MKTSATPSATARARLGLIVSMTVFGTIGLFVRRIEITSAELALCRAGLAAVFLLLSFLVTRRRLCLSEIKKSLWLLLASGAAMGINWMLLFEAYQYTTISLATLVLDTSSPRAAKHRPRQDQLHTAGRRRQRRFANDSMVHAAADRPRLFRRRQILRIRDIRCGGILLSRHALTSAVFCSMLPHSAAGRKTTPPMAG